ncbi:PREDICTED: uncharacterized protein LOC108535257 [Rhinopithecus bieti]|uniref:uncharacterized protein LOC108535257 n=1 Tax=Rhinopithecus bieti TaxID=61621 RepID=UPI00083BAD8E|nr:PREDICTED: uncharacterized protein LOC108535257 [Rhinopithecus bieti]
MPEEEARGGQVDVIASGDNLIIPQGRDIPASPIYTSHPSWLRGLTLVQLPPTWCPGSENILCYHLVLTTSLFHHLFRRLCLVLGGRARAAPARSQPPQGTLERRNAPSRGSATASQVTLREGFSGSLCGVRPGCALRGRRAQETRTRPRAQRALSRAGGRGQPRRAGPSPRRHHPFPCQAAAQAQSGRCAQAQSGRCAQAQSGRCAQAQSGRCAQAQRRRRRMFAAAEAGAALPGSGRTRDAPEELQVAAQAVRTRRPAEPGGRAAAAAAAAVPPPRPGLRRAGENVFMRSGGLFPQQFVSGVL